MKKNKINQEENIILDEETKIDEKKKPTAKKIAFAILLILLAVMFVVLGFCVVGGVFDVQTQCNVAYAYDATLPDDGKVGDNILFQSSNFTFLDDTLWVYNESLVSFSDGDLILSNNLSTIQYPYQKLSYNAEVGEVFTLSIFVTDIVQPVYIWLRNVGTSVISGSNYLKHGLNVVTYSITKSGSLQFAFSLPINSSVSISWIKVEVGSTFTGYIRSEEDLRAEYDALSNWQMYYYSQKFVSFAWPIGTLFDSATQTYIKKDTNFKVFLVPYGTKVSDIINTDYTLKLKIKGLNTDEDVGRGLCYQFFDLTGYREFYSICAMALRTPKTMPAEGATNSCDFYTYDTATKSLYEITPYTFPDKTTEERYLDIVNFYEDFGRNSEQTDFKSSTDGIISVIQSPVNFLKDIFNFEIFGINVSAVVFFVLSIVIVAFVIKKVV